MALNDKILLVDDERDIVDLIEEVLRKDGFTQIRRAYTGREALRLCREFQPDVMILDIMLPDMDGLEVCGKIREYSYCSILFLSSRNDETDKILGLACGGDDYITKPFSPREVVFRVKAQLRRQQYQAAGPIEDTESLINPPLSMDRGSGRIYKEGRELSLTGGSSCY